MTRRPPYFILSCARSGSTSLARILDAARNGHCASEPVPNLNAETRDAMDGRLGNRREVVDRLVVPRVRRMSKTHEVYGEKNVTYGPFVPELHAALRCRFVYLKRDGRDVVRSLMDWHNRMFGSIYRECADPGDLTPHAREAAARLPVHHDTSDYARPRPLPEDEFFEEWETFSREEMCGWYFDRVTHLYLDQLERLSGADWVELDYTRANSDAVAEVARFLGLAGLEPATVAPLLEERINSLQQRIGEQNRYPRWTDWDSGLRDRFTRVAESAMVRAGFWSDRRDFWRPSEFGRFWVDHEGGEEWYQWMYESRRRVHRHLVDWVSHPDRDSDIRSIVDFGCGLGVGYCDDFADRRYVGVDLAAKNVEWCRRHRVNGEHSYWCHDHIAEDLPEKFDLVFSSGTIDNSYDVDQYLASMVRNSRKWVYLTCYRGWFPELDEHRYTYNREQGCFYNDVSARRAVRKLRELGCPWVRAYPVETGRSDICRETLIVARVAA